MPLRIQICQQQLSSIDIDHNMIPVGFVRPPESERCKRVRYYCYCNWGTRQTRYTYRSHINESVTWTHNVCLILLLFNTRVAAAALVDRFKAVIFNFWSSTCSAGVLIEDTWCSSGLCRPGMETTTISEPWRPSRIGRSLLVNARWSTDQAEEKSSRLPKLRCWMNDKSRNQISSIHFYLPQVMNQ